MNIQQDKLTEEMENLLSSIKEDLQFDDMNLRNRCMKLNASKHNYLTIMMRKKKDNMVLDLKRKEIVEEFVEKLREESIAPLSDQQLSKKVNTLKPVQKIDQTIKENQLIIELLEHALKNFSETGFLLKSIVELIKIEEN